MTASSEMNPGAGGGIGSANRLKLGIFAANVEHGGTISTASGLMALTWDAITRAAVLADDMGLEAIVSVARWKGFGGKTNYGGPNYESLSWAAGLAAETRYAQIFATCHVPVINPIVAANQLITIDHISNGRAGLNTVGGWYRAESEMFGQQMLEHDKRYDLNDEWTAVVQGLLTNDHEWDFEGEYFTFKGLYAGPKPIQSHIPLMNAGSSGRGMSYAAEHADMVFIFLRDPTDIEAAKATVSQYKTMAHAAGRHVQVWTLATVVITDTAQEAAAYDRRVFEDEADYAAVENMLRGIGLETKTPWDQPDMMRKRFIAGWGGAPLWGTPDHVAEGLARISEMGCDGCLLMFPEWETGLTRLRDEVLPMLEQTGHRAPFEPASLVPALAH